MNRNRLIYILVGVVVSYLVFKIFGDTPHFRAALIVAATIWLLLGLLAIPFFYKKSLEARDKKDLSRTLMLDPQFREAILNEKRSAGKKPPDEKTTENKTD